MSADGAVGASAPTDERVEATDEEPNPKVAELEGRLRRALADLDNLRKRFDREVRREGAVERARVAAAWLPVVDDLERAVQHAGDADGSIIEGVRAVLEHAVGVLERLGFPRFEDVGAVFDPARHEAMSSVEAAGPPGTVVAAVRPGYGTDTAILRPAGVVVSRSPG